ncbi:MAG: hypothetical protein K0S65_5363 [Labilithrix sp.]|nr:hypothetical protein [Labilithrix sp.]
MRKPLGLTAIALAVFVACGGDGPSDPLVEAGTEADGGVSPDDLAKADASSDAATTPDVDAAVPYGFEIQSKEVTIQPSQEITYCYHFKTPNTETLAISKWKSVVTPGVTFMALFLGGSTEAPGTITAAGCGGPKNASASDPPIWAYASYAAASELAFPSDDGTGKPLGFELAPGKPAYMMMRHKNETGQPITAHVTLSAEALPAGADFTKTSTFVTFNDDLAIPKFTPDHLASKTCDTLPDTRFWFMSVHTHKQGIGTIVKDGTSASVDIAYESTSWAAPLQKTWPGSPFYAFDQGKLTFECKYNNPTNRTITTGNSTATDEICMVTGYYFPATKPTTCYCPSGFSSCVNF